MSKKILLTIIFISLSFLLPTQIFAADLDIYCYENQKPLIVQNTSPLFSLSGFNPGDHETRSIYIKNYDPSNNCNIYFDAIGSENLLTDVLQINISEISSTTLSRFINSGNILMGNLNPGAELTRDIEIFFPIDSENNYQDKQASFNLIITSQWGGNEVNEEDVLGEETAVTVDKNNNEVGEVLGINDSCNKPSYWWILLIQLILTLIAIFINKGVLKSLPTKLVITILLGIISFIVMNILGCGCNKIIICTYHWIFNLIIAISPITGYLLKK